LYFLSVYYFSFESQQHVLALPQTETTSEHTFQSQQQGGGRTVEISPSGGHHQFFQRVIPSNSLQGAQVTNDFA